VIAIGVAEGENRPPADEFVNADWLANLVFVCSWTPPVIEP
jgi:hypothetical protein